MDKICKNCVFWRILKDVHKISGVKDEDFKHCSNNKFVIGEPFGTDRGKTDLLLYEDYEQYDVYLMTGKDFGCIHWEEK